MKKCLGLVLGLLVASCASADLVYWQVNTADKGMTPAMQNYAYAKILAYDGKDVVTLSSVLGPGDTGSMDVTSTEMEEAGGFYADLSKLSGGDYSAYSFAVEIYGSDDATLGSVGWSSAESLKDYIVNKANFDSNWTLMNVGFGSEGWKAGAAPEPTSGLLMILGAAMLGLRRKRVA